jgi:hypothetical protein
VVQIHSPRPFILFLLSSCNPFGNEHRIRISVHSVQLSAGLITMSFANQANTKTYVFRKTGWRSQGRNDFKPFARGSLKMNGLRKIRPLGEAPRDQVETMCLGAPAC